MDGNEKKYFPFFIDISDKTVVVVGAGTIGTRRIRSLLEFACHIRVIDYQLSPELKGLWEKGILEWIPRGYQEGDCDEAFLVLVATNHRELNEQVAKECKRKGIPVNVADSKEDSDFYFPGIATKDNVVVGITASGSNHRLAAAVTKRIKGFLDTCEDTLAGEDM
ncbi:MAG TPA: bifunctional precorrin-2 dehydrogenase/sirohydrochlorin ferrochelatase [Lachnospiraceae bacterium]|nr:bifunctional precorrin-2 dehydrogenase/sirohydrochlorin ferrochelatase [Lachnospiraceae bacterium]